MKKKQIGGHYVSALLCLSLIAGLICALPSPAVSKDEVVNWNFSMWGPRRAWSEPVEEFIVDMDKATKGRWKIKMHYGSVLSPAKEQLDGIKAGMFEACGICVAYHPGKAPLHRVLELPFIAPTKTEDIAKMTYELWKLPALKKELLRWNAVPFLPLGICQYHLMGNKAIRKVEDLRGARIRMGGDIAKVLKEFGAVPTLVPASEVYETLSRGTIDLVGLPYTYAYGAYKIHEVSKYLNIPISLGTMNCPAVMNKTAYEKLPDEFKKLHQAWYEKAVARCGAAYAVADAKWEPIFKKTLQIIEFPESERDKLVAKAKPVWEEWVVEMEKKGLPGREVLNYLLKKRKEITGK